MKIKPDYKPNGGRYEIINLIHHTGIISRESLSLLKNIVTLKDVIIKLKKEDILQKTVSKTRDNTYYIRGYYSIADYNKCKKEGYFDYISDEAKEYYKNFAVKDLYKMRVSKKSIQDRIQNNADTVVIMKAAGIEIDISKKEHYFRRGYRGEPMYLQSRELKSLVSYRGDNVKEKIVHGELVKDILATRITGLMISEGVGYCVYNSLVSENLSGENESLILNFINNWIQKKHKDTLKEIKEAIIISRKEDKLKGLVNPKAINKNKVLNFIKVFTGGVYVLPYNVQGRQLLEIMKAKDWKERIRYYRYETTEPYSNGSIRCDSYDKKTNTYGLLFCIPDIKRLRSFIRYAKNEYENMYEDRANYEIYCFDFQEKLIKDLVGDLMTVYVISIEELSKGIGIDI